MYATYTPLLKAKLEALEESAGVALFADVRYGHKKDFIGYPTAEFFKKASTGEVEDTHQNERIWEYTLLLIYEYKGQKTHEEVEELMDTTVDKVIEAFDQDPTLSGNCMSIEVAPVNFYDIILEEPFIYAEFSIKIKDFVNHHV
jgi:hypothetical protein